MRKYSRIVLEAQLILS